MTELFERISEEKRNRILQASINEFSNCGYEKANTNIIAKKAEISVGSLFQYFENKEDLFLTTIKFGSSVLKVTLEDILEGEEDIIVKVEKVLRTIQKHSRENVILIKFYNEIGTHTNPELVKKAVEDIELLTAKLYSSLIEKLQKEGEARLDCDPKMFAFLLDNLFVMFQFSYACDYYRERFKIFLSEDIFEKDDFVVENTLKFIKAAFSTK